METQEIIDSLKSQIEDIHDYNLSMDEKSWGYELGVILTGHEAEIIIAKWDRDKQKGYEKEFVEWIGENCTRVEFTKEWIYHKSPMEDNFFNSTDELHEYWLTEIKGK